MEAEPQPTEDLSWMTFGLSAEEFEKKMMDRYDSLAKHVLEEHFTTQVSAFTHHRHPHQCISLPHTQVNIIRKTVEQDQELRRQSERSGTVSSRVGKHATADELIEELKEQKATREVLCLITHAPTHTQAHSRTLTLSHTVTKSGCRLQGGSART